MQSNHLIRLRDNHGNRIAIADLPTSIAGLDQDDPYRSLMECVSVLSACTRYPDFDSSANFWQTTLHVGFLVVAGGFVMTTDSSSVKQRLPRDLNVLHHNRKMFRFWNTFGPMLCVPASLLPLRTCTLKIRPCRCEFSHSNFLALLV